MTDTIKLIATEDFRAEISRLPEGRRIISAITDTDTCKIEMLDDAIAGYLVVPNKKDLEQDVVEFGVYVTANTISLIGDKKHTEKIRSYIDKFAGTHKFEPNLVLFEILDFIIKDDYMFIQRYEEQLEELEDALLDNESDGFEERVLKDRKELLKLQSYYQQLNDVADTIVENQNKMIKESESRLFTLYAKKLDRLYDSTLRLKEYIMQLRELRQSQIDIRQNEIMKVLTVVTSLIMPLTLITGWYGMNFQNMPELHSPVGYAVVIALSVVIIIIEIIIFKIRKWF